ncbi:MULTISPECIES: ABC transporter permease [Rhizobium]|jgi:spermidine/putrescine transport system permease protein|uniref:Spermidine/putrescine transport system permease protein PotC n=1 Tax=Rhizobium lusitanum TaxID=293958 RepID=A0A1C3WTH8_9HYPH|nr:ABC transporter permease [Rhizobium lusitanum]SCB43299.1 spermidine/putrescine transport system permease protein [Rhizobium lusitanum]
MASFASTGKIDIKRQTGFGFIAVTCLVSLYLPILVVLIFSFNNAMSIGASWQGFSMRWYVALMRNEGFFNSAILSVAIAIAATIMSTIIGTMAALATTRVKRWRGQSATILAITSPLIVPEIVSAVSLLAFFSFIAQTFGISYGILKIVLAHTSFCIPFVYLPIKARLEGMDVTLENAAADLYADRWKTFRYVTLPLLLPGISSGAALAFIVSFDDFTITQLIAGPGETTLPLFIWSRIRNIVTPELNAMCTALLVVSIAFIVLSFLLTKMKQNQN